MEKLKKLYNFSTTWTGSIIIVLLLIFFVAQAFVIPSGSMKNTLLIGDHLFVKKFSYGIPVPHIPWLEVPVMPDFNSNGHIYTAEGPKREEIVVFRYPKDPKQYYVKRCVGVGGDEIIYTAEAFYLRPNEGDEYIKTHFEKQQIVELLGKLWVKNPFMNSHDGIYYENPLRTIHQMNIAYHANALFMKPILVPELQNESDEFEVFYAKVPKDHYFMLGDNRDNSSDSRFWGPVPYSLIIGKPWFIFLSWDKDYVLRWNRIGKIVTNL